MPRGSRYRRWGLAHALAAFALLAMAVRALVPAGYMLSAESGRFVTVTLCSGLSTTQAVIDRETGAVQGEGGHQDNSADGEHAPCVFAQAAPMAAPEIAPSILIAATLVEAPRAAQTLIAPGRGLAAPPPFQTGPPATA